jgi:hypothetical protein
LTNADWQMRRRRGFPPIVRQALARSAELANQSPREVTTVAGHFEQTSDLSRLRNDRQIGTGKLAKLRFIFPNPRGTRASSPDNHAGEQ